MTLAERPLVEVTQEALRLLYQHLGVVQTVRFLRQFTPGLGNYSQQRQALLDQKSLQDIVQEIQEQKEM